MDERPSSARAAAKRLAARLPDAPAWLGVGLLLAGAVFLADELGLWRANVLLGLALIGLGIALFRRDLEGRAAPAPDGPAPGSAPSGRPGAAPASAPPARRPRERSPLGWLTLGTALLLVALTAMLASLGVVDPPLVRYPSLALLVVGAGMLVGAFAGRARWLAIPGLLLVPVVLAASLVRVPLAGGVDSLLLVARTPEDAGGTYRRVAGSLTFDLSRLEGEGRVSLIASVGVGDVSVAVPRRAQVRVVAEAGYGAIVVGRRSAEGVALRVDRVLAPRDRGGGPTIELDLRTGFGTVAVGWAGPDGPRHRRPGQEGG
ncbi:MAG TPA: hypothetical protein VNO17_03680 [Actinomycetota bacterium]|nr:hypothetical protein [Actinomycetota bacterium]